MAVDSDTVRAIRAFNRFYTQRIGVLGEHLLGSAFSLTEVRVLYELATVASPAATHIATQLGLDTGYLSRLLARFERLGLIARSPEPLDARRRQIVLTAKGRSLFAALDARAAADIRRLLADVDAAGQADLLAAFGRIRQILGTPRDTGPILLRDLAPGDLGWIIERHGVLYAVEHGYNSAFETLVAEVATAFRRQHDPRRERAFIAERDHQRLGCVFVVREDDATAKLRLLLLEPAARGHGLGRRLVDECVRFARGAGYRRMVLWTHAHLDAARRIYHAAGFRRESEELDSRFGRPLVAENWAIRLHDGST
ncbi:bifunctional helix-turn-helix transcriptional regulator/GNAT family N-acetyltransferase [Tahibacter amnicola]|uniref:Helix-turn-helix domain-containing GNAT family N-acetyltransferase n=1 Tax=Tahibacter amnicola TaxID=2976241 RepID=A0ABY6BFA4_9GAMM|nr:helix-turn-helix domain-containing GNAT family N-acetyltransferase [Tahibacter amnicola]UXI68462.1 helix-turn-helix domain-containing GNAT family N-acetyltransferase [Tahibacter amnicola]